MLIPVSLGNTALLQNLIIEGILDKKGKQVVTIDLRKLGYLACDFFIVCHGDSGTQIKAIAGAIEDKVGEGMGIGVRHREGFANASWILLDYSDIVVHIFTKSTRDYYHIEDLWGDADITRIDEE
jgi:ribosome-associated protein